MRLRRGDVDSPLARGESNSVWRPGAPIALAAFREETVAFQVVVEAGDRGLEGVRVEIDPVREASTGAAIAPEVYVAHYLEVRTRSRNDQRPLEALGWSPAARPRDEEVLGFVPDVLVPVALAAESSWVPYPLHLEPRTTASLWFDIHVPANAAPGRYRGSVKLSSPSAPLASLPIELVVRSPRLPYGAVRFFAYYDVAELRGRIGHVEEAEPQLWRVLHAHHVDALPTLDQPEDVRRLAPMLDGSLFTPERGWLGPGPARPPGVASIGTYGALGDPSDAGVNSVRAIAPLVPTSIEDLILYAVDEQCDSPRGAGWRRLLRRERDLERVRVAQTCSNDPRRQDVDVVLVAADRYDALAAAGARRRAKRVWVYNGALPRSGTLLLDAPVTSLRASAWIAARYGIDRWFLWETTFWNDDNRGGHGPIDPFVTAESFHNQHGDAALGDGLLLYPGTQIGAFAAHSLGLSGVLPSMRLKNLRRGIEDSGIYALARAKDADRADAIAERLVPTALSDASIDAPASWPEDAFAFARAREELRDLVADGAGLAPSAVDQVLLRRTTTGTNASWRLMRAALILVALLSTIAVGVVALRRKRRR